jgi:hypothetical protein
MSDAPSPPANCRISSFMLPPDDWSKQTPGGRWTSKAERFPTPKTASPHHYIGSDSPNSRGPNSGFTMRSRSPRLAPNRAVCPDIQVGDGSPNRVRTTSLRTTENRFPSPRHVSQSHVVLGPTDWTAKPGAPSPTYRSHSPRISFQKPYQGPESIIELQSTMMSPAKSGTPSSAAFRATSPRLARRPTTPDFYVADPTITRDGRSAVVAKSDRRVDSLRNTGHEFGDGSRHR